MLLVIPVAVDWFSPIVFGVIGVPAETIQIEPCVKENVRGWLGLERGTNETPGQFSSKGASQAQSNPGHPKVICSYFREGLCGESVRLRGHFRQDVGR